MQIPCVDYQIVCTIIELFTYNRNDLSKSELFKVIRYPQAKKLPTYDFYVKDMKKVDRVTDTLQTDTQTIIGLSNYYVWLTPRVMMISIC